MLQFGIRAKVSTLSLDGRVERSLDLECREIGSGKPISDLGFPRRVKELLDEFFKLKRLATCETTVGMVYGHGEIGLHSDSVSTLGSAREGRWTLVTVGSGEYA